MGPRRACCSLWLSGYVEQKALVTDVKLYNAARRAAMAHNTDFLTTPVSVLPFYLCALVLRRSCHSRAGEALRGLAAHDRGVEAAAARAALERGQRLGPKLERARGGVQARRDARRRPHVQQGRRGRQGRRPRHRQSWEPPGEPPSPAPLVLSSPLLSTSLSPAHVRVWSTMNWC